MPKTDRRSFLRIGLALAAIPSTTILNLRYMLAQDNALLSIDRPPDNSSRVSGNKAGSTGKGGYNMKLSLNDIDEEDRGLLGPCGIICAGCDWHTNESFDAAKTVIQIWEGHNLADVAIMKGLSSQDIMAAIRTLKKYVETSSCPGCHKKEGGFICSIGRCVKEKGYWTCAECEDYNPESTHPCPHTDTESAPMLPSRSDASTLTCKRYNSNTIENLKKCYEIGYPAFIKEIKEKVGNGWRTWQVISNEMVVSKGT